MHFLLFLAVFSDVQPPAAEPVLSPSTALRVNSAEGVVVSDLGGGAARPTPDFAPGRSPYALGGTYLWTRSRDPRARPGRIRIAAPAGEYYVYVAWVRHPQGARDVRVRVGGVEVRVDQSRLANGLSPDDFARDDMDAYEGLCSSGLFRLTDRPVRLREGDSVEIFRSDTAPDTLTTLDYVVFSPHLYLDDVGNDATWAGRPQINLRDYGRAFSGEIGLGLAFIGPGATDGAIEWTVPVDGLFLLAANPNRGPSRAERLPLEVELAENRVTSLALAGQAPQFGRAEWQPLGVLRSVRGRKVRLRAGAGGVACLDLLRLTPVSEADLARPGEKRYDSFTLQWENPSAARPWLRQVKVRPTGEGDVKVEPLQPSRGLPHGVRVQVPRQWVPLLGGDDDTGRFLPASGSFRVELAGDYGFTLSADLLHRQPFVWLKDLGLFACAEGDFASRQADRQALAAQVDAARRAPFRSTSEKYYEWTGYPEARGGLDDQAFRFAYDPARSLAPRVSESLASLPEVNYAYFLPRIEEPKHRRMFLGWPNVGQEFYVLSNGALGISSGSGTGTGHPPAEHFLVEMGAGDPPSFVAHGDPAAAQRLEDGYHIIVHTEWRSGDSDLRATAFAYPLAGEEVRTGNEPLAAFVRLHRSGDDPLWLRVTPAHWGGPPNPLRGLAEARVEAGRLLTDGRLVLAVTGAAVEVESRSEDLVLLKLEPLSDRADLVLPYVAAEEGWVEGALARGFEATLARTKAYWDGRLAAGALVEAPDPVVTHLYKTLYPRTLVCGDLDTEGDYALKTSPINYDLVWLHCTAYGIEGLARRGHFEEARQYLEAAFRWQGSQPSESSGGYTTWDGFFNAPPRYTAALWLNYHGWMQWAAARYFLFSDDRDWLPEKLPALVKSLEWTASQRKLTRRTEPAGSRPINSGWLPPGRVTDGSAGTSTFTDCINWMGFNEVTRLLERIGHPRAAEFRAEADDYRQCILRGLRLAARAREPVRLNDGTYVPYVPGYLESEGHEETMWYAAVVDGALEGLLDSGVIPLGDPLEEWVLANLEDNLFVLAPNLADEAYFLGHGCGYLRRDQPAQAVYTFYSVLASHLSRQTLTTFEHRSWGAGRVWDLTPWPLGYYTRMLAGMLCYDEGDELMYGRATPRAWLEPGKSIRVERLQTRFGPTSFALTAGEDGVTGFIELPARRRPREALLRLRLNGTVEALRLNGRAAPFDGETGTARLPRRAGRVAVEARVTWNRGPG